MEIKKPDVDLLDEYTSIIERLLKCVEIAKRTDVVDELNDTIIELCKHIKCNSNAFIYTERLDG